jgi:hypothetical protein
MNSRFSRAHPLRLLTLAGAALWLAACGGEGSKYSGKWERDVPGAGEGGSPVKVSMDLGSNGDLELMLPSRWTSDSVMKAKGDFKGDTLVFKADSAARACQTADARYVVSRNQDELRIAGVGMDTCGGRRAALVGTWKKS